MSLTQDTSGKILALRWTHPGDRADFYIPPKGLQNQIDIVRDKIACLFKTQASIDEAREEGQRKPPRAHIDLRHATTAALVIINYMAGQDSASRSSERPDQYFRNEDRAYFHIATVASLRVQMRLSTSRPLLPLFQIIDALLKSPHIRPADARGLEALRSEMTEQPTLPNGEETPSASISIGFPPSP